ncbi:MAG: hypothetical protein RSA10_02540 [Bacilli bacterium]
MKSIYKKVEISFFFVLLIFLSLISGLFKDIICFFLVIIIHEMGHVIISLILRWKIKSVKLGICGGYIVYDEIIDKPFFEEFLISISGIVFQIIFFVICTLLLSKELINDELYLIIKKYHYAILIFNLLPIIPLDGSKILSIILNKFVSYNKSLYISSFISGLFLLLSFIFCLCTNQVQCSNFMILFFLIDSLIKYVSDIPYLYNKFILERYLYPKKFKRNKYVKNSNLKKMKRQTSNYFYDVNRYHSEREVLKKRFD